FESATACSNSACKVIGCSSCQNAAPTTALVALTAMLPAVTPTLTAVPATVAVAEATVITTQPLVVIASSRLAAIKNILIALPLRRLSDLEQLHFENQGRVGRDHAARAARAVAQRGRNHQPAHAALLHALHALVPALDHVPGAKRKLERIV